MSSNGPGDLSAGAKQGGGVMVDGGGGGEY
jgi:hypothetical protein